MGSKESHNASWTSAHQFAGFQLPNKLLASIEIIDNRVELVGEKCQIGPCHVENWRLHLPQLKPPIDACLDAQKFQQLRGTLTQLSMVLPLAELNQSLAKVDFSQAGLKGLQQLQIEQHATGLVLSGLYIDAHHVAPLCCPLAIAALGPDRLQIVFEDVHVFGSFPTASVMLPIHLQQGLFSDGIVEHWPNSWLIPPATLFASDLLPRVGWKIPDSQKVRLANMQLQSESLHVALLARTADEESSEILALSAEDLRAAQTIRQHAVQFSQPEALLLQNKVDAAYAEYHKLSLQQPNNTWIKQRLLKLGVTHPQWASATERLAHTMLDNPAFELQARLTLAALALKAHNIELAAVHYGQISEHAGFASSWIQAAARVAEASCIWHKKPHIALEKLTQIREEGFREGWIAPVEFQIFSALKKTDKAHAALESWLSHVAQSPYAKHLRKLLVRGYLKSSPHDDQAQKHLQALIDEQPEVLEHRQHQLDVWVQQENWSSAIETLKQIARIHAQNQNYLAAAECLVKISNWAQTYLASFSMAEKSLHAIFEMLPEHPVATLNLAQLYDRQNRRQNAHALYGQLVEWVERHSTQDAKVSGLCEESIALAYFRLAMLTDVTPRASKNAEKTSLPRQKIQWLEKSLLWQPHQEAVQDTLLEQYKAAKQLEKVVHDCLQWAQRGVRKRRGQHLLKKAADAAYQLDPQGPQTADILIQVFIDNPTDESVWSHLVQNLLPRGHTKQLIELLQRAIFASQDAKQRAHWRFYAVELFQASNRQQDTEILKKLLDAVVQDDPAHILAQEALAKITQVALTDADTNVQRHDEALQNRSHSDAVASDDRVAEDDVAQQDASTTRPNQKHINHEHPDIVYETWMTKLTQAFAENSVTQIQHALMHTEEIEKPSDRFLLILHFVRLALVAQETQAMREALQYAHYLVTEHDMGTARPHLQNLLAKMPELFYERQVWDLLQALDMPEAQAIWLEKSLELHPVPDDGRFEQCVDLHIAVGMPKAAWQICEHAMATHPQYDVTWSKGLEVAFAFPEYKAAELVFDAWSQKRVGEQKAIILEAYATYLQSQDNQSGACHVLWQAAQVTQDTRKQEKYLQILAESLDPQKHAAWLVDVLQSRLRLEMTDTARDSALRILANLYAEHLQDPAKAAETWHLLSKPSREDKLWLLRMWLTNKQWTQALSSPVELLEEQQTSQLLEAIVCADRKLDFTTVETAANLLWERETTSRKTWQMLAQVYRAYDQHGKLLDVYDRLLTRAINRSQDDILYLQLAEVVESIESGWYSTEQAMQRMAQIDLSATGLDQDVLEIIQALQEKLPAWSFAKVVENTAAQTSTDDAGLPGSWEMVIAQALSEGDLDRATRWSQHMLKQNDVRSQARLVQIWIAQGSVEQARDFVQSCQRRLDTRRYQAFYPIWVQGCIQAGYLEMAQSQIEAYPQEHRDVQWAQLGFDLAKKNQNQKLELQSIHAALSLLSTTDTLALWRMRLAEHHFTQNMNDLGRDVLEKVWSEGTDHRIYSDAFALWTIESQKNQDVAIVVEGLKKRYAMLTLPEQEDLLLGFIASWKQTKDIPDDVLMLLKEQWHCNPLGRPYQCLQDVLQKRPLVLAEILVERTKHTDLDESLRVGFLQKAFETAQRHDAQDLAFEAAQSLLADDKTTMHAKTFCVEHALKTGVYPKSTTAQQAVIEAICLLHPENISNTFAQINLWQEQNMLDAQIERLEQACLQTSANVQDKIHLAVAYECKEQFSPALQMWIQAVSGDEVQSTWLCHAYEISLRHKHNILRHEIIERASDIVQSSPMFGAHQEIAGWQALRLAATIKSASNGSSLKTASDVYENYAAWPFWSMWLDDVLEMFYQSHNRDALSRWLSWGQDRDLGSEKQCADRLLRQALWLQKHQQDLDHAHVLLKQARDYLPKNGIIQAHLGLSYWKQEKPEKARSHLETSLKQGAGKLTEPVMLTLLDCFQIEDDLEQALEHCHAWRTDDAIVISDITKQKLFEKSSEYLCALEQWGTAEVMWQTALESEQDKQRQAQIHKNLADIALKQDAYTRVHHYLDKAKKFNAHDPDVARLAIQTYASQNMWQKVVDEHLVQASQADDVEIQVQHWIDAAACFEHHLDEPEKATVLLEKACQVRPRDSDLLQRLMDHYTNSENISKKMLTAERLLALFSWEHFDADFFMMMAQDYRQIDPLRAEKMASLAYQKDPDHPARQGFYRSMLIENQHWSKFVKLEKQWLKQISDDEEYAQRAAFLGETLIQQGADLIAGIDFLKRAAARIPDALSYQRQLAAALARDPHSHQQAIDVYQGVLKQTPMDTEILRVLARLTGQQGNTERAYGYYACLLCLLPNDAEASDYVLACRRARKQAVQQPQKSQVEAWIEQTVPPQVQPVVEELSASLEQSDAVHHHADAKAPWFAHDIEELFTMLVDKSSDSTPESHDRSDALVNIEGALDMFVYAQSHHYFKLRQRAGLAFE